MAPGGSLLADQPIFISRISDDYRELEILLSRSGHLLTKVWRFLKLFTERFLLVLSLGFCLLTCAELVCSCRHLDGWNLEIIFSLFTALQWPSCQNTTCGAGCRSSLDWVTGPRDPSRGRAITLGHGNLASQLLPSHWSLLRGQPEQLIKRRCVIGWAEVGGAPNSGHLLTAEMFLLENVWQGNVKSRVRSCYPSNSRAPLPTTNTEILIAVENVSLFSEQAHQRPRPHHFLAK